MENEERKKHGKNMHNYRYINIYFTRELQGEIKGLAEEVDFEKNRLD